PDDVTPPRIRCRPLSPPNGWLSGARTLSDRTDGVGCSARGQTVHRRLSLVLSLGWGGGDGFDARLAWLERLGRSLMSVNDSSPMPRRGLPPRDHPQISVRLRSDYR